MSTLVENPVIISEITIDWIKCPVCKELAENVQELKCCDSFLCLKCANKLKQKKCPSCQMKNF